MIQCLCARYAISLPTYRCETCLSPEFVRLKILRSEERGTFRSRINICRRQRTIENDDVPMTSLFVLYQQIICRSTIWQWQRSMFHQHRMDDIIGVGATSASFASFGASDRCCCCEQKSFFRSLSIHVDWLEKRDEASIVRMIASINEIY